VRSCNPLALVAFGIGLSLAAGIGCTPGPIEVAVLPSDSLTNGMVAHWALDEDSGTVANDGSGNARSGFIANLMPGWMKMGQFGSALHFSGADYVSVNGIPRATPSYSVSAWTLIQPYELGAPIANIISTEAMGGGWALYATLGPGNETYVFRFALNAGQQYLYATCTCVVTGAWTHLAAVVDSDGGTLTLYVNGVPVTTPTGGAAIQPGSAVLYLARSGELNPTFPLTGALDDVVIYSRALVPEEVAALGQAAAPNPQ
jgi:Concanavalin A-like lectin/glucanases superfamily